jgi:hypothetical protein
VGPIRLVLSVGDHNDILRACGVPARPMPQTLIDFQRTIEVTCVAL